MRSSLVFLAFCSAIFPPVSYSQSSLVENNQATAVRCEITLQSPARKYSGECNSVQLPHGVGRMDWIEGYEKDTYYSGEFKDGKITGKGVLSWYTGERHEGYFVDGERTGKGIYTNPDGYRREGDFLKGELHGKGIEEHRSPSGTIRRYEGDFIDGRKNGMGKLTLPWGDQYNGKFSDGKYNGKGVYTHSNGQRYSGEFLDGQVLLANGKTLRLSVLNACLDIKKDKNSASELRVLLERCGEFFSSEAAKWKMALEIEDFNNSTTVEEWKYFLEKYADNDKALLVPKAKIKLAAAIKKKQIEDYESTKSPSANVGENKSKYLNTLQIGQCKFVFGSEFFKTWKAIMDIRRFLEAGDPERNRLGSVCEKSQGVYNVIDSNKNPAEELFLEKGGCSFKVTTKESNGQYIVSSDIDKCLKNRSGAFVQTKGSYPNETKKYLAQCSEGGAGWVFFQEPNSYCWGGQGFAGASSSCDIGIGVEKAMRKACGGK